MKFVERVAKEAVEEKEMSGVEENQSRERVESQDKTISTVRNKRVERRERAQREAGKTPVGLSIKRFRDDVSGLTISKK